MSVKYITRFECDCCSLFKDEPSRTFSKLPEGWSFYSTDWSDTSHLERKTLCVRCTSKAFEALKP